MGYDEPVFDSVYYRAKIFEDIDRMINPDALVNRVVYDLDETIKDMGANFTGASSVFDNSDVKR